MRQTHFNSVYIRTTTTIGAVFIWCTHSRLMIESVSVCKCLPPRQFFLKWRVGGARCPFLADGPQRLQCLGHWRSFKVMLEIFHEGSRRSLSPIVSASHYVISLERKKLGGRNSAGPPFGLFGEIDWDSTRTVADGEGASAAFTAVVRNLLTREQQNIVGVIVPFKRCDSSAGRRFTSNGDVSPEAWQQHWKMPSVHPKIFKFISAPAPEGDELSRSWKNIPKLLNVSERIVTFWGQQQLSGVFQLWSPRFPASVKITVFLVYT